MAKGKNDKTEAVLPQAHQEKVGFFEKENNAGKKGRAGRGED